MNEAQQIERLLTNSVETAKSAGVTLQGSQSSTFPVVPKLRSPIRYVTDKLGIRWAPKARSQGMTLEFYERRLPPSVFSQVNLGSSHRTKAAQRKLENSVRHRLRWVEIFEEEFKTRLGQACVTPRLTSRVLSRMHAFTAWMMDRKEGLERARTHVLTEQAPWVEALNAKIAGLDLAGAMVDTKSPLVFNHNGTFATWPYQLRDMLIFGHKIPAIKLLRDLTGFGLADAKNYIERALSIYGRFGRVIFADNITSFYNWPH